MLVITEDQSHIKKSRLRCNSIFQAQISLKVMVDPTFMCFNFQSTYSYSYAHSKYKKNFSTIIHTQSLSSLRTFSAISYFIISIVQKNWLCRIYTYAHYTNAKFTQKFLNYAHKQKNKTTIMTRHMQKYSNSPTLKSDIVLNVQNIKQ